MLFLYHARDAVAKLRRISPFDFRGEQPAKCKRATGKDELAKDDRCCEVEQSLNLLQQEPPPGTF
jgi:hypothetical protein